MKGNEQPKILIAVTNEVSARIFLQGFIFYLVENGFSVTLIANEALKLKSAFSNDEVSFISVPFKREPSFLSDIRNLLSTFVQIYKLAPDVVMYATPKASLLTSLASFFCRVPTRIYWLWGIRFETENGIKKLILRCFEQITSFCSTSILANSKSLAAAAKKFRIAGPKAIYVLGKGSSHGVDVLRYSRELSTGEIDLRTQNFLDGKRIFTIGFVGRLHPDKGIETLINSAELLSNAGIDFRIIIVGQDEGYLESITSVSFDISIHCVGNVEDIRPYLKVIDVLVLMSRREGFPNVVLEAGAMEVVSIVSDATGCVDSVVNGKTGYIVPTDDSHKLAKKLIQLNKNPSLRKKLGSAARTRVENDFKQEIVWSNTLNFIRKEMHKSK